MITRIIVDVINAYILLLFVRIILTWFPINPWSRFATFYRWVARLTDPVLAPVRRLIRPIQLGSMALDLSPIIVFVALEVIVNVLRAH